MSVSPGLTHINLEELSIRQCAKCKSFKLLSEFSRHPKSKDGYREICRMCACENTYAWVQAHPFEYICSNAKKSARKRNLEFNLTPEGLVGIFTERCPVSGRELDWASIGKKGKRHDYTPSLDRKNNDKGYVDGNVFFVAWRYNRLKSDGNLDDFRKLVAWLEKPS